MTAICTAVIRTPCIGNAQCACSSICTTGTVSVVLQPCCGHLNDCDNSRASSGIWPQVVRARANNRLTPAQARRRREELARVPEFLLCVAYCILVPSVLLGPCVVIWVTNADPLQAAPLTFAVRFSG